VTISARRYIRMSMMIDGNSIPTTLQFGCDNNIRRSDLVRLLFSSAALIDHIGPNPSHYAIDIFNDEQTLLDPSDTAILTPGHYSISLNYDIGRVLTPNVESWITKINPSKEIASILKDQSVFFLRQIWNNNLITAFEMLKRQLRNHKKGLILIGLTLTIAIAAICTIFSWKTAAITKNLTTSFKDLCILLKDLFKDVIIVHKSATQYLQMAATKVFEHDQRFIQRIISGKAL